MSESGQLNIVAKGHVELLINRITSFAASHSSNAARLGSQWSAENTDSENSRRHAHTGWNEAPEVRWPGPFAFEIDNIRTALEWAFSPEGDAVLGIAVAAASTPIWLTVPLLSECLRWTTEAIAKLPVSEQGIHHHLVLKDALASAVTFTGAPPLK